ncbi:hypothetical protein NRP21_05795 [Roseomonas pecuniae]|uniref:DUF4148 domain-containing protein n=2 Tax=Roseomonas populi TaxID=3121582 RepID=A0ABT1X192_9PROT|nr:hypothetical protein [Roseomonas pecuniae]
MLHATGLVIAGALLLPAMAAEPHSRSRSARSGASSGASSQDMMADQLNAQSLQRAQSGQGAPGPGPDTTGNLNRMSEQDAARGRAMQQPPMPFR